MKKTVSSSALVKEAALRRENERSGSEESRNGMPQVKGLKELKLPVGNEWITQGKSRMLH